MSDTKTKMILSATGFFRGSSKNCLFSRLNPSLFVLIVFFSLSGCGKDEGIPAYLYVPEFSLTTTTMQGTDSHNITDVWVYNGLNLLGIYELPAHFPILEEGEHRIIVLAGIKINGVSSTRTAYPFFQADTFNLTLQRGKTDTLLPSIRYLSSAVFSMHEDFELSEGFSMMQRTTDAAEVFEGNASGLLIATDTAETIAVSNAAYVIPFTTDAVFLEMNYKNNHIFEVGIKAFIGAQEFSFYKITVPPRADWNKLYVNFTPEIRQVQADNYRIYFRAVPDMPADSVKILFDNLKLIYGGI